jgi:hypothetical protein
MTRLAPHPTTDAASCEPSGGGLGWLRAADAGALLAERARQVRRARWWHARCTVDLRR